MEKKLRRAKTALNNSRIDESIMISKLKVYYRAIIIKTAWYNNKKRHNDPDISSHTYGHLISYKEATNTHWRKKESSKNGACQTGYPYGEECKYNHIITLHKSHLSDQIHEI